MPFAEERRITDVAAAAAGDLCLPSWQVSLQLLHWTLLPTILSTAVASRMIAETLGRRSQQARQLGSARFW